MLVATRKLLATVVVAATCFAQLKTRDQLPGKPDETPGPLLVIPAGTRLPIQLRQALSTKNAQPGDAVYAQTVFPVVASGGIAIPAGTWVQGVVDTVKRAGRIKGTAELQFHLTSLIYANGHTVDMAAAIAQVPGSQNASVREPGVVKQDSEKGKDFQKALDIGSKTAQMGALTGVAVNPSIRALGVGGLAGIAAGTLIALLGRGSDVRFDAGTSVELALTQAIAIDKEKALKPAQ